MTQLSHQTQLSGLVGTIMFASLKNMGEQANRMIQKKETEARIWEAEKKIKGFKEEWGVAAFDAHLAGDQETLTVTVRTVGA